jgi:hypothetical protein
MGESGCLQLAIGLHDCLPLGDSSLNNLLWYLLVVVNIMFAGRFFFNLLDDILKEKKWLKYRDRQ